MGYASLNFANNGTVLTTTVLHDIVGCVTGRFSSSLQLQGASTSTSEIVNTLGQNWNFTYPASGSFVNNSPNNTLASWVLTAPCVNPSKNKFARLTNLYNADGTNNLPTLNSTGTGTTNLYKPTAANMSGVLLQGCSSASSATSLTNQTAYTYWATTGTNSQFPSAMTGTNIIVSWSSRHLIVWSNGCGNSVNYILFGIVEFPETDVTTAQTLVPVAMLIERNGNLNTSIGALGANNINTTTYGDIQFPDFYLPSSTLRAGVSVNGYAGTIDTVSSYRSNVQPINTVPTINSTGTNTLLLMPIIANIFSYGIPNMYLSALTNVYIVSDGLGNAGDTLSVDGNTYAYLPSNTGLSFVVKKE